MKMMVMCSIAVLACSCHQDIGSSASVDRRHELSRMVDDYFEAGDPYRNRGEKMIVDFKGPPSIRQVEEDLIHRYANHPEFLIKDASGLPSRFLRPDWTEFKGGISPRRRTLHIHRNS